LARVRLYYIYMRSDSYFLTNTRNLVLYSPSIEILTKKALTFRFFLFYPLLITGFYGVLEFYKIFSHYRLFLFLVYICFILK